VRAVRENIQPRSYCIDRAIARSIQQDRGGIFSRTAQTVEASKFFIIWHCTFVKNGKKGHASEGKVQYTKSETFAKKTIVKNVFLVSKTILYTALLYRITTQFG
jgi:hypothetical protein